MIPNIENKKVVFLLNSILADEIRHHAMLKMVLEIIVHGETITEEDGGNCCGKTRRFTELLVAVNKKNFGIFRF